MKKLLYKLAKTKACIIAFIMPRFTPFRNIAAEKSTAFLNEANRLQKEHLDNRIIYGDVYMKTQMRGFIELHIKWLEFKATFLIKMFLLNGA